MRLKDPIASRFKISDVVRAEKLQAFADDFWEDHDLPFCPGFSKDFVCGDFSFDGRIEREHPGPAIVI